MRKPVASWLMLEDSVNEFEPLFIEDFNEQVNQLYHESDLSLSRVDKESGITIIITNSSMLSTLNLLEALLAMIHRLGYISLDTDCMYSNSKVKKF